MLQREQGLTLIEMLVVILIISILVGLAFILPRGNNSIQSLLQNESVRLAFLFNTASEEALLSGNTLGFSTDENLYRWWEWDRTDKKWTLLINKEWAPHILPEGITVSLDFNEQNTNESSPDKGPNIIFYSDGTTEPFTLTLLGQTREDTVQRVLTTDGVTPFGEN